MKNNYTKRNVLKYFSALILTTALGGATAQTATFEDLALPADTFWNGSDLSGGFTSGSAFFVNSYDTVWGSWKGFAYSNKRDITTSGYTNQYSAYTGWGFNGSSTYAVVNAFSPAKIRLTDIGGTTIKGFYVTNTTYAALSMRDGDAFAKKFGGTTGNDPDWFKLSVTGWLGGTLKSDTVHFYLADYRDTINSNDYILNTWKWVDLTPLGNVDSLSFSLSSSDTTGSLGMNTPAYFAMDNFSDFPLGITDNVQKANILNIYPNPATSFFNITLPGDKDYHLALYDYTGKMIFEDTVNGSSAKVNISELPKGIYIVRLSDEGSAVSGKFVKE